MVKITCQKHDTEFEALDGCPQCIEDRQAEGANENSEENIAKRIKRVGEKFEVAAHLIDDSVEQKPAAGLFLVKGQFYSATKDVSFGGFYTYYSEESLKVGDIVKAPGGKGDTKIKITAIDVDLAEIEAFKDKVKIIPAGSVLQGEEDAVKLASAKEQAPHIVEDTEQFLTEQRPLSDEEEAQIMAEGEPVAEIVPSTNIETDLMIADVQSLVEEANRYLEFARVRVVNDPDSEKKASTDLNLIRTTKKAIGAKRKEYLDPINAQAAEIRDFFKQLTDPIEEADKITSGLMLAYSAEVTRQREEADRLEAKRLQLAKDQEELTGEHTVSLDTIPKPEEAKKRVRTNLGLTSKVDHWKFKVVDLDAIPREYLIPDEAMLNSIAKKHHDGKPVAGILFFNDPHMSARSK